MGKEIAGKAVKKVYASDIEVMHVKQYLDYKLIHDIACKLGLPDLLKSHMKSILLLVYTQLVSRKSLSRLPEYVEHTALKELLGIQIPVEIIFEIYITLGISFCRKKTLLSVLLIKNEMNISTRKI